MVWTPECAMKTLVNGEFYIPNISGLKTIKIDLWCNDANPSRMEGDQTGGSSPYPNLSAWPDGNVSIFDSTFVSGAYGKSEGEAGFKYMADVVPNRKVDIFDVSKVSGNYGQSGGSYTSDLTDIHVVFSTSGGDVDKTPNEDGYISIPDGTTKFTVKRNADTVMAVVTFYKDELLETMVGGILAQVM